MRSARLRRRSAHIVATIVAALALAAAPADARSLHAKGGFSIAAPAGWKLSVLGGGAYRLSCGSQAAILFARFRTDRGADGLGDALVAQLGGGATGRKASATRFSSELTRKTGARTERLGVLVRKRGTVATVARYGYVEGRRLRCATRARRASAAQSNLLADLARLAAGAAGGVVQTLQVKRQESLLNGPVSLRRFETSYLDRFTGERKFVSALVPEAWVTAENVGNVGGSDGFFAAVAPPSSPLQGFALLGLGNNMVYRGGADATGQGCFVPQSPNLVRAPFVPDPQTVLAQIWGPARNAFDPQAPPIANVAPVQLLADNYLQLPNALSQLWFFRLTIGGAPWNGIMAMAPYDVGDPCSWFFYTSVVAVADASPPGLGLALLQTWASWSISFQSNQQSIEDIAKNLSPQSQTDFLRRIGAIETPVFGALG